MTQLGRDNLFGGVGGAFVREVTVSAENPLLEAPGAMRAILQHFHVVIGLKQEHVGAAHPFNNQSRGMAEVG
jgi:hypothetical protein